MAIHGQHFQKHSFLTYLLTPSASFLQPMEGPHDLNINFNVSGSAEG